MANLLPESESTEVEGRVYINPQTGVDEANTFIENLRQTQQANTQQIAQDTRNLGTDVPSSLGGLGGATGYWTSRYQTPQTASAIADLRTAAQAQALNEALANEQAVWKNRYQQAYRNYQKRQYDKANKPATPANPTTNTPKGDITTEETTVDIGSVQTEGLAKRRYQALLFKYLKAGYPTSEAEAHAKEDFGKSIDVDAPVEPYKGE